MTTTIAVRDFYQEQSARIEREFEATSRGHWAIAERAALVDRIIVELCTEHLAKDPSQIEDLCIVALGGYGR